MQFPIQLKAILLSLLFSLLSNQALHADEISAIEKVMPAVVHIGALKEPSTVVHTVGGGVVIASSRDVTYVLTVKHNVVTADHLFVKTLDGTAYQAAYYVADAHRDLAIIRVDTEKKVLPVAEVGDSRELKVGQTVFALGFPTPVFIDDDAPTVSRGIVSAINRTLSVAIGESDEVPSEDTSRTLSWKIRNATMSESAKEISMMPMIQVDLMVNSGSSGGPLITTDGKVVGVVHSMISNSGSNVGMNFVVPVSEAELLLAIAGLEEKK